jgi:hypothetical protein
MCKVTSSTKGREQVFFSRLLEGLGSLIEYDGSGEFFKIAYAGPKDKYTWSTMEHTDMNFIIPAATPSELCLLRIEHFFPSSNHGQSKWFVNCAHIEIVGGEGKPGSMVRFPDPYSQDSPSI